MDTWLNSAATAMRIAIGLMAALAGLDTQVLREAVPTQASIARHRTVTA